MSGLYCEQRSRFANGLAQHNFNKFSGLQGLYTAEALLRRAVLCRFEMLCPLLAPHVNEPSSLCLTPDGYTLRDGSL